MSPPDTHIRDWLKALAALIAPAMSGEEIRARIDALTPHLITEFPPAAFNRLSLTHTARLCRFFPNFAELCDAIAPHWHQHRPLPPMIQHEPIRQHQNEPTEDERAHVARITAETVAALRAHAVNDAPARPAPRSLSQEQLVEAYAKAGLKPPQRHA